MTRLGAMGLVLPVGAALVMAGSMGARAQVGPLDPLGTTTTTAAPRPSTTTTTAAPVLANPLDPKRPPAPAPPPPANRPATSPLPPPPVPVPENGAGEGAAPPPEAGPFPPELAQLSRSVRRTGPGNSNALVNALSALTDLGMPLEEAVRVGMGRFPVAGRVTYSHDWWFPRFGPGWRLHQGTDLFGARGTPLRSPTDGVVRFANGGLGGIATYVVQSDGTYFYFAHLEGRPKGLKDGQAVRTGDIVGLLGSSGNASGGSPHLHFEVHPATRVVTVGKGKRATTKVVSHPVRPGTVLPAVDPKPILDFYLKEALAQLPAVVAAYQASRPPPPPGAGPAVPAGAVAVPGQELAAAANLVPAEPPLVRGPLLALAFLLVMMVGVLTPVLTPRRRLVGGPPPSAPPSERMGKRAGRRRAPPPPPAAPDAEAVEPATPRRRRRGVRSTRKSPPGGGAAPDVAA